MSNLNKIKKIKPQIILKGWGREEIVANEEGFCGKLLFFDKKGHEGSTHYHLEKLEFFYVAEGAFLIKCINPIDAKEFEIFVYKGESARIPRGHPHRIVCLEAGYIVEFSTPDYSYDSYRVVKGDSQK